MAEEEAPPPESIPPESPSSEPRAGAASGPSGKDSRRRRLEGVIPEIVRRAVELGVEKAQEAPDNLKQFVGDMKVPKDIAHYLLTQVDETKNGLFRVVAKEMRDFLEHTNFAGEVQKLLTTVQFEVNTTIRFTPNDGKRSASPSTRPKEGPSSPEEETEPAEAEGGEPGDATRRPTPLPKPEVKTAVHVRRDDDRKRRRDA